MIPQAEYEVGEKKMANAHPKALLFCIFINKTKIILVIHMTQALHGFEMTITKTRYRDRLGRQRTTKHSSEMGLVDIEEN